MGLFPGGSLPASADLSGSRLIIDTTQADQVAGFSSRGPVGGSFDSLIKPDLTAPGVSVLAAVADPGYLDGCSSCASTQPETYGFYDGTSMAAPHDTGTAALLMQAHPSWTPSEIKSALMLTAVTSDLSDQCQKLDASENCVPGSSVPTPQVRGAGRTDVYAAERAGLMLDETGADYAAADPSKGGDLTALNLASLGNRACAAQCTWTRTVTSTFDSASVTYAVSVSGLTGGLALSVSPSSFALAPHQSQVLTIKAGVASIPAKDWVFGAVVIKTADAGDGGVAVSAMHMPVAVESTGATLNGGNPTTGKSGDGGGGLGCFELAALMLALGWRRR